MKKCRRIFFYYSKLPTSQLFTKCQDRNLTKEEKYRIEKRFNKFSFEYSKLEEEMSTLAELLLFAAAVHYGAAHACSVDFIPTLNPFSKLNTAMQPEAVFRSRYQVFSIKLQIVNKIC